MRLGSFTLDGTTINVDTGYNHVDGVVYHFTQAKNEKPVAVTTYRGIKLAVGAKFDKADLQRGLDSVRRPLRRLSPGPPLRGARRPT
jgi:hypothetical protein